MASENGTDPTSKPIRLVIADVDGTLVTRKKMLTARSISAIDRLRLAGIEFTITSGRPPRGMAMLIEPLKLTRPIAAFNGGMLTTPDLKTVLEQRVLPLNVAKEVVDDLLSSGLDAWVYRGSEWLIRNPNAPHVAFEKQTVQFEPTVTHRLMDALDGAVKIVGVTDNPALISRSEAELRERVGSHLSAARTQSYYLDVTHPDANKGMVVRMAARACNIPLEQIAVIGDMPNDVLMFGIAGMSIAMGNASPEVQRTARYVTTSNEQEGFAIAMERFVLKMP